MLPNFSPVFKLANLKFVVLLDFFLNLVLNKAIPYLHCNYQHTLNWMIMKRIFLCFTLSLGVILTFAQPASIDLGDSRLENLAAELDSILPNLNAAGFAVAIVEKDKIIYSKGFGYRDYEKKIPADANTLFAIGSCSKAFTASLLGQLRKDDKVDFDESPITYLPDLRFFNDEMNNNIKIRDMMSHRTGLPRHDFSWYVFYSDDEKELIERLKYQEPTFGIRERWQYNNFMFLLQGAITREIMGKPWHAVAQESIMNPLGMERTNFNIDAMEAEENASLGYVINSKKEIEKTDYYRIRAMGAAGSINSSVNEMANWVTTWINGGKFQGQEILPADYVKEAMSSQMIVNSSLPGEKHPDTHFSTYGYGWMMHAYRGHYLVEHGGNIDGFSANTSFFPSDSIGIIVLANQNGSAIPGLVRNIISDRMLGLESGGWHKEIKDRLDKAKADAEKKEEETDEEEEAGIPTSHALEDFVGSFANPGYGTMKIELRNDSLFAHTPAFDLWMQHHTYDYFKPIPVEVLDEEEPTALPFIMNFQTDINGRVTSVEMPFEAGLDPIRFTRKEEAKEMDVADLKKYEGKYALAPGVLVKVYVKDETTLYVEVPGQPEYELTMTGNHSFALNYASKPLEGYSIEFKPNDDGVIESLQFVQPNGIFKAKKQ